MHSLFQFAHRGLNCSLIKIIEIDGLAIFHD